MSFADPVPTVAPNSSLARLERDGFVVLRRVVDPDRAAALREIGCGLINSRLRRGRETQPDGWDSFRGAAYLNDCFGELGLEARILTFVTQFLGANLHLMSSQLIR